MKKCLTECNKFYCVKQDDKKKGIKCRHCILKDADPICEVCIYKYKCYKESISKVNS